MSSLNKVMLIGNLGADPEMKFTNSGTPVVSFRLAMNSSFTGGDGEKKETTEWVSVVAWQKLAELVTQYLKKGSKVYVEGRLQTRSWEGQQGKQYKTEVVASTCIFLDATGKGPIAEADDPEDLPF